MIVVDTSALIAVASSDLDAEVFASALMDADKLVMSTGTMLELSIVASKKLGVGGWERVRALVEELRIDSLPFDADQLEIAVDGYAVFGRGSGHPAKLNYGDCFSYALAKSLDAPLLYKGNDFAHTDIRSALLT